MAELNLFHYLPGHSLLHRMDPRRKVAAVALLSVTVGLAESKADLLIVTLFIISAAYLSRLTFRLFLEELRRFTLLIVATILIQAWGGPGAAVPFIPCLSQAGLMTGALFAWRLVMVVIIGLLLTGTTRLVEIRGAIYWFLRLLPLVPAARVATMFSLTLNLIPLIFDQAATVREAQLVRGIGLVKNPLKRLYCLVWPVMRETFGRADELILALESRCYSETRTMPVFSGTVYDPWVFAGVVMIGWLVWIGL
jgi:energy-coupling factor transporter transmembrane protein EcfT